MAYYVISAYDITDQQSFEATAKGSPGRAGVEAHGGKMLAVGAYEVHDGEWPGSRGSIVEWPDRAAYEAHLADVGRSRRGGITQRAQVGLQGR